MSERHLPDWLDAYMDYTDNSEPPKLFRLWVGISVIAAAMQRKCCVEWGMLTFYPNLYVILVGPAATRKGTAMYPGQALLRKLEVPMAADATTLQALIRRLKEASTTVVDSRTHIPKFHSSMTIFSKEFTVFLGYKNNELIASLCDWYDCDERWKYDTKNQGTDEILGVWVNLVGATTPDLIQSSLPLEAIGGGLTSRVIFVYEQKKGKLVVMPFLSDEQKELEQKLFIDLEKINLLSGKFQVTENFVNAWSAWRIQEEQYPPKDLAEGTFSAYVERRPNHMMKLSMIMSTSRSSEMIIRSCDFERALHILTVTEQKMPGVFAGVGRSDIAYVLQQVLQYVKGQGERGVTYDLLMRMFYQDADGVTLSRIIETLETAKYIQVIHNVKGPNVIKYVGPAAMVKNSTKE